MKVSQRVGRKQEFLLITARPNKAVDVIASLNKAEQVVSGILILNKAPRICMPYRGIL